MVAVNPASFGPRQAQPLENFMTDAKSIVEGLFGKTDPKDLPPMAQAAIEARARIRSIAAQTFPVGAAAEQLLEHLADAMLRRPFMIVQPGVPLDQAALYGAKREGQADAIYYLLALIAEGRSEQAPQREGAHENTQSLRKRRVSSTGPAGARRKPAGTRRRKSTGARRKPAGAGRQST